MLKKRILVINCFDFSKVLRFLKVVFWKLSVKLQNKLRLIKFSYFIHSEFQSRNDIFQSRNHILHSRNHILHSRNLIFQSRNDIFHPRNHILQSRNDIFQSRNDIFHPRNLIFQSWNHIFPSLNNTYKQLYVVSFKNKRCQFLLQISVINPCLQVL